jgi:serine/threonine protein kinase
MPSSGKQSQNLTQTGEIFGSRIYMSPEQCLGQVLDKRSDIYSTGAMLYETLLGSPPLMGDTIIDTMQMHVTTPVPKFAEMRPDLQVPVEMERVTERSLEKDPDNRFSSMQEFRDGLIFVSKLLADRGYVAPAAGAGAGTDGQPRSTKQRLTAQKLPGNEVPKPMMTGDRMSDSLVKKEISADRMTESVVRKAASNDRMSDSVVKKAIPMTPGGVPRPGPGRSQTGMKAQTQQASPAKKQPVLTQGKEPMQFSPLIIASIVMGVLALLLIVGIVVFKMIGP